MHRRVSRGCLRHPVSRRDAAARALLCLRAVLLCRRSVHARLRAVARLEIDGIPAAVLARRWGVPQCGVFRSLTSSLDAIHDLGAQGAPAGTVILAEEQTAGRGRDGRTWRSPAGGVWLGMLLRPPLPPAGVLSLRVGLVLADVVEAILGVRPSALSGPRVGLKWPNDVLVDDRKVAGAAGRARHCSGSVWASGSTWQTKSPRI
ncbi:MAG: biotin--[acetyl-CoA-carboxylase] ligase [Gemmatimonadetes bacterium]|nr:MAG: biotin--[acetyl-CoA-carboxylase] ligase [Gemmatimonadota bacterium]